MEKSVAMETFLKNIEKALNAATLRWSDIASRTGIAQADLYRLRAGRHRPRIDRAELIAESIGYSLHEILDPHFRPKVKERSGQKKTVA